MRLKCFAQEFLCSLVSAVDNCKFHEDFVKSARLSVSLLLTFVTFPG